MMDEARETQKKYNEWYKSLSFKDKIWALIRMKLCNGTIDCENYPECPEGTDGCEAENILEKIYPVILEEIKALEKQLEEARARESTLIKNPIYITCHAGPVRKYKPGELNPEAKKIDGEALHQCDECNARYKKIKSELTKEREKVKGLEAEVERLRNGCRGDETRCPYYDLKPEHAKERAIADELAGALEGFCNYHCTSTSVKCYGCAVCTADEAIYKFREHREGK